MRSTRSPRRFRRLPIVELRDRRLVPVAATLRARLLGLALLDRGAAAGLLIPRCRAVHTLGMRFPLDLYFLDSRNRVVSTRRRVPPWRWACDSRARSVLELPCQERPPR